MPRLTAAPPSAEARAKPTSPTRKARLRPHRSPPRPPNSSRPPKAPESGTPEHDALALLDLAAIESERAPRLSPDWQPLDNA
ncbi:hypothetical protein ABZY05_37280 [Streptomyces canus]|uniref:hypothetical protein n=1 Tax=Streptomyces canus TaxID=58343 RepID=UPI0033BF9043